MRRLTVDTVVVGAGQAGLAASRSLAELGVEHVVLERGRVAEAWRNRWDSLRLLTPNWMTRLPGHSYRGSDPEGFMSRDEVVEFFEDYARMSGPAIHEGVEVTRVGRESRHFLVETDAGTHLARNVVVATGHAAVPQVPARPAAALDPAVHQLHSSSYRNPGLLPPGDVLVAGSGASGLQLACELRRDGRRVVIAAGRHARAVRRYRGRDLWWWLERLGSLDVTADEVGDLEAARRTPSLGLTGMDGGVDLDLGTLARSGVEPAGRVIDASGTVVRFGANLAGDTAQADRRLLQLLDRFDLHARETGIDRLLGPPARPMPLRLGSGPGSLDLAGNGISTVLWATGFRRDYRWLDVPVLDEGGEIIQRRGETPVEGLYVLGLRFQWTRGSHFIDRVGADARHVAESIARRRLSVAA